MVVRVMDEVWADEFVRTSEYKVVVLAVPSKMASTAALVAISSLMLESCASERAAKRQRRARTNLIIDAF